VINIAVCNESGMVAAFNPIKNILLDNIPVIAVMG
jgi:hypothetical protein